MRELGALQELVARAGTFSGLHFSTDTADPARGALYQRVQERATPIETKLLFFELEWAALDDARADELLAGPTGLDFCRHHLRTARRYRPHLLSEPEEKILTEKALTARNAWGRLFEEQVAALEVKLEDGAEPVSLEVALSRLHSPDREVRAHAAERVTAALEPGPAHARLRLQHAAGRQDGRRPAARLPALAREPQPRQRGLRRVRRGARHRGAQPLRAAAALVPAQGEAARARPARRLRPHGRRHRGERDRRLARGARARARLLRLLLARSSATSSAASSTSAGSTRRCAPASAAARSAPTPCRPCTPT